MRLWVYALSVLFPSQCKVVTITLFYIKTNVLINLGAAQPGEWNGRVWKHGIRSQCSSLVIAKQSCTVLGGTDISQSGTVCRASLLFLSCPQDIRKKPHKPGVSVQVGKPSLTVDSSGNSGGSDCSSVRTFPGHRGM